MPALLIELWPLIAAIFALLFAVAGAAIIRPLLSSLGSSVPVVGHYLRDAALAVERFVLRAIASVARTGERLLGGFIGGLGSVAQMLAGELTHFAGILGDSLDYLRRVVIARAIDTAVQLAAAQLRQTALGIGALIAGVQRAIDLVSARANATAAFVTDVLAPRVTVGLDSLREWVRSDVIPTMQEWTRDLVRPIGNLLADTRARLALLTLTVAGVLSDTVTRVQKCRDFLDWICNQPKDFLSLLLPSHWDLLGARILERASLNPSVLFGVVDDAAETLLRTL